MRVKGVKVRVRGLGGDLNNRTPKGTLWHPVRVRVAMALDVFDCVCGVWCVVMRVCVCVW